MTELNHPLEITPGDANPSESTPPTPSRLLHARPLIWTGAILLFLVVVALVGWWNLPPTLHGIPLQSRRAAEDFTLLTSTGEEMNLSDFRGKYVMLFFGYTFCPDVCPTTLNDLQQMVKSLGPQRAADVQVLMISVDPERDRPEQLATYMSFFDPAFIGMTGSVAEIQPIASQYGVFFERQPGSDNTNYLVDHTSAVTVIDPEGHVRMIFTYGVTGAEMASDLAYLMRKG